MSQQLYSKMKSHANFYYWNDQKNEIRLVFSFDNTVEEITEFVALLREYAKD
jgi:threonine aldolase